MTEEWKPIPGFDGYEVSDLGRVRSHKRSNARMLALHVANNGYLRASLARTDGTRAYVGVHRLVAMAFVPGQAQGLIVCHNDSVKTNNVPSNLRWDTISSNAHDASRLGDWPTQKLDIEQVKEIRRLYETGEHTNRSLAAKFGVTHQAIRDLLIGKNYRWVA